MRGPSHDARRAAWLSVLPIVLSLCLAFAPIGAYAEEPVDLQEADEQQVVLSAENSQEPEDEVETEDQQEPAEDAEAEDRQLPAEAIEEEGQQEPAEAANPQEADEQLVAPAAEDQQQLTATIDIESITDNGDVVLSLTSEELLAAFSYGDTVSVSFLGQTLDMVLHRSTSRVSSGTAALLAKSDEGVTLTISGGDFATTYGIAVKTAAPDETASWEYAEGVEGPIPVEIVLKEKARPWGGGNYVDLNHGLKYKNNREDYPQLSDEEFTNFRMVSTTGMGENILYRTSHPVNPRRSRSPYADAALEKAGVTVIMNLSDNEDVLTAYEGYDQTYYSTVSHVSHLLGLNFTSDSFKSGLGDGLRFFAQNPGVYAVHCIEGKDRTGFTIALLECLMGASEEEVIADYMVTFYNYFGVTPEDELYNVIAQDNIVSQLKRAFEVESLSDVNLSQEAEEYILSTGLTPEEVAQLKENLNPTKTYQVTFNANGHGVAPEAQEVKKGSCATRPDNPTAEGFAFGGWYLDKACTKPYDFAAEVTGDVTLFARWTEAAPKDEGESKPSAPSSSTAALPKTSDPYDARVVAGFVFLGLALTLSGLVIRHKSRRK